MAETCPDGHVDRCRLRGPHHSTPPRRPPGHGPIEHVEPNSRSGRRRAFGAEIGFLLMSSRYRRVSERQPTRDPPRTIPSEGTEHSRSIHRRQDERVQAVPASKVKHLRGPALPHHVQQRHIESLDRRPAGRFGEAGSRPTRPSWACDGEPGCRRIEYQLLIHHLEAPRMQAGRRAEDPLGQHAGSVHGIPATVKSSRIAER